MSHLSLLGSHALMPDILQLSGMSSDQGGLAWRGEKEEGELMASCVGQTRCVLPALGDPQGRCTRCIRLKVECVYKPRGSRLRCEASLESC